jgi:hypothetical protein
LYNLFNDDKSSDTDVHTDIAEKVKTYENSINLHDLEKLNLTSNDISFAMSKFNLTKCLGFDGTSAFMFLKCKSKILINSLVFLFNCIINTNIFPHEFNVTLIKPILKDNKKGDDDLNNVRPISISNFISQLFERIFLIRLESIKTSNNQFGFKPKSSCNLTTFSLRETINYYVENGSPCYMAALDAERHLISFGVMVFSLN